MAMVLIIDDEPAVASSIQRALASEHEVEIFASAAPALEILRSGKRYGAILCDLSMPGLSGLQFHQEVQGFAQEQAARIIFVSGGVFQADLEQQLKRLGNPLLNKPFTLQEIRESVRSVAGR